MNKIIEAVNKIRYFLAGYLALAVLSGIILLSTDKGTLHLFINKYHNGFFDIFFKYVTFLGDGITATIISIIFLFINRKFFLVFAGGNLLGGFFVQLVKLTFFNDALRPKAYFANITSLHFVPGVEVFSYHSFPSGHSATAFIMFTFFAAFAKNKYYQAAMLLGAMLIAFSRIYLSEHFYKDIFGGSVIGIVFGILAVALTINKVAQKVIID